MKKTWHRRRSENEVFDRLNVFLPKHTTHLLKKISYEKGLPISRIIGIAVDKEMDKFDAFDYPAEFPTYYDEFFYSKECEWIIHYLNRVPRGLSIDQLMMARRDMKIESKEILLTAVKELIDKKLIEVDRPRNSKFHYFKADYRVYRLKGDIPLPPISTDNRDDDESDN